MSLTGQNNPADLASYPNSIHNGSEMRTDYLDYYISRFILNRLELHHDVMGTPFEIGQKVLILDNPSDDETFDKQYAGRCGEIIFFEFSGGCGQSFPNDPMIGVKIDEQHMEEFWREELMLIPQE